MTLDELAEDKLTLKINQLWIHALRGFQLDSIQFVEIRNAKRDSFTPQHMSHYHAYFYKVDEKELSLDAELLNGWMGNGYQNTSEGYDTKIYKAFTNGVLGKKEPKDIITLSYTEALKLYGNDFEPKDAGMFDNYHAELKAYNLGKEAAVKHQEFLKDVLPKKKRSTQRGRVKDYFPSDR